MILVALMYAILAWTFVIAKKTVAYANPCFLIGFRMTLAGGLLLAYSWLFDRPSFFVKRKDWGLFFRAAIFHIYLAFVLEFWALQYVSALKTTIIYSSTPFIAAILSYFILKERLSWKKIYGILIGIGGLVPVVILQAAVGEGVVEFGKISMPELVLFAAVFSAAYAWFLVKELMVNGYGLVLINGMAMIIGGFLSLITAFLLEGFNQPVSDWSSFLGWILLLILVANIIVYNFYGWLLKKYSITFLMFAGWLCPFFGTFYEWFFMGGQITWHYFASLILVLVGLYIFYQEELWPIKT